MKRSKTALAAFVLAVALSPMAAIFGATAAKAEPTVLFNPCAQPSDVSLDTAKTAWQLFISIACPVNASQYPYVVWETWITQGLMYPANPADGLIPPNSLLGGLASNRTLGPSALALTRNPALAHTVTGLGGGLDQLCNKAAEPPPGEPDLVICEEVRLNGPEENYIAGTNLWNRNGQAAAASAGADIHFPKPAIEIKADWIELTSIGYDCSSLPAQLTQNVHVETINGNCYGLAGLNLMAKLLDQWVWATFEPQQLTTNPLRCKVLGCTDDFGSIPPSTHGAQTNLTPLLRQMMQAANLSAEWYNYRLDGVQTDFFNPKLLGNSIVEGETAGVPLTQSSCITCHAVSSVKNDGTDGITLLTSNPVGLPAKLPSNAWIRRDFVWSLSEACLNSPFQSCSSP
jgi:hypothetical protein